MNINRKKEEVETPSTAKVQDESVIQENGKWFYLDETWNVGGGPYDTKAEAEKEQRKYCIWELGNNDQALDELIKYARDRIATLEIDSAKGLKDKLNVLCNAVDEWTARPTRDGAKNLRELVTRIRDEL